MTSVSARLSSLICWTFLAFWSFLYKQCTSSLPLFQRNTNKHIPFDWRRALLPETVSTYDRLLVSVTLEKREGACALFVQKTPDMFTNLPSARKTLLDFWLSFSINCLGPFLEKYSLANPEWPQPFFSLSCLECLWLAPPPPLFCSIRVHMHVSVHTHALINITQMPHVYFLINSHVSLSLSLSLSLFLLSSKWTARSKSRIIFSGAVSSFWHLQLWKCFVWSVNIQIFCSPSFWPFLLYFFLSKHDKLAAWMAHLKFLGTTIGTFSNTQLASQAAVAVSKQSLSRWNHQKNEKLECVFFCVKMFVLCKSCAYAPRRSLSLPSLSFFLGESLEC